MSIKAMAAVVAVGEGEGGSLNVSEVCREAGVSRKTFYKWVARYRAEGVDGLEDRSRRPHSTPHRTSAGVEDWVVTKRKELDAAGLDHGATTIQWHLGRDLVMGGEVASVATIHRILVRRGLVTPQAHKRPKGSWRRFEAPAPNEWWQIDAMDWPIAIGMAHVFNVLDDHSRVAVRSRAVWEATSEQAWGAFSQASEVWGMPAGVLSDNGLCFSGKLRGFEVLFEANLRDVGIRPITSRPYHPQTTGKVERFQQTEKKWLRGQPLAADLDELQDQLDRFIDIYNWERPHQGIGRVTPASRWAASPAAGPASEPLAHPRSPSHTHRGTVNAAGAIKAGRFRIHLGVEWAGHPAKVIMDEQRANVFIDHQLVRHLELDHSRSYQPSGRRRGGPRRPRLPS